jgi:hypothetical protein
MRELYLAECRRFGRGASAFAAAHVAVLAVLQQVLELTSAPVGVHLMMLFLYMLAGCGFAIVQLGSYRQPSRWIWLLHRPLHRGRILAALVLAALTLDALAVALPQAIVLAANQHFTHHVIDQRHYAGAACLALATLAGWLGGGYVMLHRSRWACMVLALPVLLGLHLATAATVIALWLACDAALLLLLYTVFCPNRSAAADQAAAIPGAMVLQVGFYLALLWTGTAGFQVSQLFRPVSGASDAAPGYSAVQRLTAHERLLGGLPAGSAPPLATQIVGPVIRSFAVPNLVSTRGPMTFTQGEDKWTFSEDRGMYRGLNTRTGADAGWFGAGGRGATGRFGTQPVPGRDSRGGGWMVDPRHLYAVDQAGRRLVEAFSSDAGESIASTVARSGQDSLLLTNRRVILFASGGPVLTVKGTLALPLPFGDLDAVDSARTADGTLVSLLFGYRQSDGGPVQQRVYLVDDAGAARELGRRELVPDFPPLYQHRAWWLSPLLHAVVALPDLLIDTGVTSDDQAARLAPLLQPRPASAWTAAITAMLLAGAGAAWWLRRTRMAPQARLAWCLACLLLGLPALLALTVMAPIMAPIVARLPATGPAPHRRFTELNQS